MLQSPHPITNIQPHRARPMADIALLPRGPLFHLRIRAYTMSSALQPPATAEMILSPLLNRRVAFWLLLIYGIGTVFVCDTRPISLLGPRRKEVKSSKIEPEEWAFLNVTSVSFSMQSDFKVPQISIYSFHRRLQSHWNCWTNNLNHHRPAIVVYELAHHLFDTMPK